MKKWMYWIGLFACLVRFGYSATTHFIVARHGETDWNQEGLVQGATDRELTAKGEEQAQELANRLKEFYPEIDAIYSSDLLRALVTAKATGKKYDLDVHESKALRERCLGQAEGMKLSDFVQQYSKSFGHINTPKLWGHVAVPGAEPLSELFQRVEDKLIEIGHLHSGQTVAVFTHGWVLKVLLTKIIGFDMTTHISNCSFIRIDFDTDALCWNVLCDDQKNPVY